MNNKLIVLVAFITAFFVGSLSANDKILGKWATEGGKSHVELSKCGDAICGKIVWLETANESLNKTILEGFKYNSGDDKWKDGKFYDPKSGKSHGGVLEMKDNNSLMLTVKSENSKWLSKKPQTWTRVK